MKNVLSAILLVLFVLSPISSTFAQKSRSGDRRVRETAASGIEFGTVSAAADRRGALIQWEMSAEPNTLGYYVYRVEDGVPTLVSEKITLSEGTTRGGLHGNEGGSYRVYDPQAQAASAYYVEAISLDGERIQSDWSRAKRVRDVGAYTGQDIGPIRTASISKDHAVEASLLSLEEELETVVTSSLQTADAQTHQWVVSQPGASIMVRREGMHRVPRAMLESALFPVNSDSNNWRLFLEGVEQPIIVGPGAQYIEFYGKGVDTTESDLRAYYLISDTVAGKRIPSRTLRPVGGNVLAQNFAAKALKKDKIFYLPLVLNGDEQNYWGMIFGPSAIGVSFTLRNIDYSASTASVKVRIQGHTAVPHQTQVGINGNLQGIMTANNRDNYSQTFQVPTSQLIEGTNTLNLNTFGSSDFSAFDEIVVDYKRKYVADQNVLAFSTQGYRRVNVSNFSSANVRVFDITADGDTQLIKNAAVVQDGATFTARIPSSRAAVYYAVEDSALLTPPSVIRNNPSSLNTPINSANLVIISHSAPDFMAAAETWANYRRGQGFAVKVVDVRDVYDEFNYGVISSPSIESFLQYAFQNWQTPPQYVLLLGDASWDPRNYENVGAWNLVPTRMVNTPYGEISSDEALADFNNDGLSELAIGRIPARTIAQLNASYNKTVAFELPANQSFNRGSLFAYDEPKGYNFQIMSQTLRNQLPISMPAAMVDRLAPSSATTLLTGLNTGKYIVNYSGHGSSGAWYNSTFFGTSQAQSLTNSPSIFTMLTCFNGLFARPDTDSLGERLQNSAIGGSVVSWASTSETTPDVQLVMAERFYGQIAQGTITRMGDLVRDAKQLVPANGDVRFSWALLGDPMLKVR